MTLPRVLKNMDLYNEGFSYVGQVKSVKLPTLGRKMEGYRSGGMPGEIQLDMGTALGSLEATFGGPMRDILRQFGAIGIAAVYLRFAGAYQNDETGAVDAIEVIVRGRHEEIDMGEAAPGSASDFKTKFHPVYYKLVWNGRTEIEIDLLNMVETIGGVDRLAAQRQALGRF